MNISSNYKNQPWSVLEIFTAIDDALYYFINTLKSVLNCHALHITRRVKHVNQPDWFTHEIAETIKVRDKAKQAGKCDTYNILRSKVK
jgi:hypothetical protein